MKSVAIVGEMASGKTTLADVLVEKYGYTRVGFANRLKETAMLIYGVGQNIQKGATYYVWQGDDEVPITGRALLQQLGQSVKTFDRNLWVNWLLADLDNGTYGDGPFVIDDCRFPYEANALRGEGFVIARIVTPPQVRMERYELNYGYRPSVEELNHPSEAEVKNIKADALFDGTDTVSDLSMGLLSVLREDSDL